MEHLFSKNSMERQDFVVTLIFDSELYMVGKHWFNQGADFKQSLIF